MKTTRRVFESLTQARKLYLDTEKIDKDTFNILADRDSSRTKKYIEWMCKQYILIGERPEHIGDVIKMFSDLTSKNLITDKDINSFKTLEDLEHVVNAASQKKSKTQISKDIKKDAEVVLDDENFFIVIPRSYDASKQYGANTKWCTAGKNSTYWDSYTGKGVQFYYIVNKKDNKKYAVAVYMNGKKEVFDELDKSISYKKLKTLLGIA